jgi:CRISPR-associated protein Cas1
MSELLRRGIDLLFYSTDGHYFGRFQNPERVNVSRQRLQVRLSANRLFCLPLSINIVRAKINNQMALLRAYNAEDSLKADDFKGLEHSLRWITAAKNTDELAGFEGNAAKAYFAALAKLVPEEFNFTGRSKRPPKDPFNSLISFGYSLLFRNIIGAIERHGLNPYFGFMHADKEGHPALVSDLIEEWRAVIVDDTVMQLLKSGSIEIDMFTPQKETGAVFISHEGMKILTKALGEKMCRAKPYIVGTDYNYAFQYALDLQINQLVKAMETEDPGLYRPIMQEER